MKWSVLITQSSAVWVSLESSSWSWLLPKYSETKLRDPFEKLLHFLIHIMPYFAKIVTSNSKRHLSTSSYADGHFSDSSPASHAREIREELHKHQTKPAGKRHLSLKY